MDPHLSDRKARREKNIVGSKKRRHEMSAEKIRTLNDLTAPKASASAALWSLPVSLISGQHFS
jgi:hypothetical protein